MLWCAAAKAVIGVCGRALAGGKAASFILIRKKEPLRIITFAAYVHGKQFAFGSLLGLSSEQSAKEYLTPQAPSVSYNKADQVSLIQQPPNQPENAKILKIAIIGAPNAGKSTLSNQLLGRKLFPVSSKVHTTRCQARGVITEGDTQLILLDTPGMVSDLKVKRHNLEESLKQDPWESVKLADVVLVLVDVSVKWMRRSLHMEVLKCLSQNPTVPSILVLNKVDQLKDKGALLEITDTLTEGVVNGNKAHLKSKSSDGINVKRDEAQSNSTELSDESITPDLTSDTLKDPLIKRRSKQQEPKKVGWSHFQDVFMLSAIHGDEVDTLKRYLIGLAKPGEWLFHSEIVTTQSPQEICDNMIREKLLEYLPEEIPYKITQVTNLWEEGSSSELIIMQTLMVGKKTHMKKIIGTGGQLIHRIATEAGQDLSKVFLCDVRLRLAVKYKK